MWSGILELRLREFFSRGSFSSGSQLDVLLIAGEDLGLLGEYLQRLRMWMPDARFTAVVAGAITEQARRIPDLVSVLEWDPKCRVGSPVWRQDAARWAKICYDQIVVLPHWDRSVKKRAEALAYLCRARVKVSCNDRGQEDEMTLLHLAHMVFPSLVDTFARLSTRLGVILLALLTGRIDCDMSKHMRKSVKGRERIAYLLWAIPDSAFTFVYREALELGKISLDIVPVALHRPWEATVMHGQARQLLARGTTFVPREPDYRLLLRFVGFLVRHPRRVAGLYLAFRRASDGAPGFFLSQWETDDFLAGFSLARVLERERVTHVHTHFSSRPTTRAMVSASLIGATYSFTAHSCMFVKDYPYQQLLEEKIRSARFAVGASDYARDALISIAPGSAHKVHAIRSGVRLAPEPSKRQEEVQGKIVAVGRLVRKKGFHHLIGACARLRDTGVPVRCTIVGGGPEDQHLRSLVQQLSLEDVIEFTGPMPYEEVDRYYVPTNIMVAPCVVDQQGERDGIPTVLIEAMAAGMPVVSTPVAGIPELVRHLQTGLLVPPGDEDALAQALTLLLSDDQLRRSLGENGRNHVAKHFSLSAHCRDLANLLGACGTASAVGADSQGGVL